MRLFKTLFNEKNSPYFDKESFFTFINNLVLGNGKAIVNSKS